MTTIQNIVSVLFLASVFINLWSARAHFRARREYSRALRDFYAERNRQAN